VCFNLQINAFLDVCPNHLRLKFKYLVVGCWFLLVVGCWLLAVGFY
jgi:hypothetical protein